MDALDGKGDVKAIAQQLLELPDGQANPTSLTPLEWLRRDVLVHRDRPQRPRGRALCALVRELPYNARSFAFDPHLAVLHCEPKFLEILRALKVEEPHLAAACPKAN